jgi:hypothetical protein
MDDARDLEALEVERDFRARQERGETDTVPPDDDMMPSLTPALPIASKAPPPVAPYTAEQIRYSEEHGGGLGSAGAAPNPFGIGTYDAAQSSAKSKGKGKTTGKSKDKSKSWSKDMSKGKSRSRISWREMYDYWKYDSA